MPENRIRSVFLRTAMLASGLGMLAGPGRALAQRPLGIDVSSYQGGSINWTSVKSSGVVFAWAKATEGLTVNDADFSINETNAKAAGVLIGAYHFAHPELHLGTAGADAEAAHFWGVISNYVIADGLSLMPALDYETSPGSSYTKATSSQWVNEWCQDLVNYGQSNGVVVMPVVYTYTSFASDWLDSTVTQWPLWMASPNGENPQTGAPSTTSPWSTWAAWQYGQADISGITTGAVDEDVFHGTLDTLVATLVIGGATPIITNQPVSQTVLAGANVTFSVGASSAAPLFYQWRFNGSNLAGATLSSYTTNNVPTSDTGSYSVVVSNQFGSVTSSNALLTVNGPPSITGQPQSQVVSVGQNVTFTVAASGTPPLSYQWQFNGTPLPGATAPSCLLAAARSVNAGSYSVVVSNSFAPVVSSIATLGVIQDVAYGDNTFGQGSTSGISTNLIAIAAGAWHNLALGADGTVIAWGDDSNGQCDVPAHLADALAIAAGGYHSLALQANGSVVAWGADDYGQTNVPAGLSGMIGIAAGTWHSVALRADGTVVVWGDNSFGQTNQPTGLTNVIAVAAGGSHTLALKADSTVVAWGENTDAEGNVAGQSMVPWGLTNVVAIGAGEYHSLAVTRKGTVVAWGDDSEGQCDVPAGLTNVVAAAGGGGHSVALGTAGQVTVWGADWNRQRDLPPALAPASGIAAGEYDTVVLLADSLPAPRLLNPAWKGNQFSALVQTLSPKNYALQFKDSLAATSWTTLSTNAGNGALKLLADPAATASQRFYRMRQW